MIFRKGISLTFLLFSSFSAQAYISHKEIVQRFKNKNYSLEKSRREPARTLSLTEVIPEQMQQRQLRYADKENIIFENVKDISDLRYRDTPIVRQIGPRCSAYGLVAGIENLLGHPSEVKISESHLFSGYRKYSSERAVYAAKRMGITEYKYWPSNRKWFGLKGYKKHAHTRLTDISFINNDIHKAIKALDAGRPVYLGMSVTRSMGKCDAVMDPQSSPTGGGHAINISGYGLDQSIPGGGYFIIKNSWGDKCGDQGYQYMPFNYCTQGNGHYCVMWDIQGVASQFAGVDDVVPEAVAFNVDEIKLDIKKKKQWFNKTKKVSVKFWGDSRLIKQVDKILVTFQKSGNMYKFMRKVDEFKFKFKTKETSSKITVYYHLKEGNWVIKDYKI